MKVLAGFVGGFILAVLGMFLVAIMFAASATKGGAGGALSFFVFWIVGFVIALKAPSAPKAWRRLLVTSAIASFLLPLSGIIFTGSYMATKVDPGGQYAGAEAAGAAIGGGLISGALGFVGFFLGVVLLIIGLLVGRDKQVIYVQAAPGTQQPGTGRA